MLGGNTLKIESNETRNVEMLSTPSPLYRCQLSKEKATSLQGWPLQLKVEWCRAKILFSSGYPQHHSGE
jgi:hypothetical protein